jgi:adenylosuccinate lyase
MPHKRNPVQFENVKSLWKAFMPRSITLYLDQLSEHQRDLTNSASSRFVPENLLGLFLATLTLHRAIKKIKVDKLQLKKNFLQAKTMVAAEPLYVLLALHGHPNAHEKVRRLALKAGQENKGLLEIAQNDKETKKFLKKFSEKQLWLLHHPETYTGIAFQKTKKILSYWKKKLKKAKR